MPIPSSEITTISVFEQYAKKMRQSTSRDAFLLSQMFTYLWSGDSTEIADRMTSLNTYAASHDMTTKQVMAQHAELVAQTISRIPELASSFSEAPVDLSTLYDANDMISISGLTAALEAL